MSPPSFRNDLGESLSFCSEIRRSARGGDHPLLEALKAFSLGIRASLAHKVAAQAISYLKRAVELDPNFAMAHTALATSYTNLNQVDLGIAAIKKAFELRDRVTERERSHITTLYYDIATGEADKATEGYKQWLATYPRDITVHANLANEYMVAGHYQDAVDAQLANISADPNVVDYLNLAGSYVALNKFDEAQATIDEAFSRIKLDDPVLHENLYTLDFIRGDTAKMDHEVLLATGKSGWEDLLLYQQSNTAGWHGRVNDARSLTRRAAESATRADTKESAALYLADAALRDSVFGFREQARQFSADSAKAAATRDAQVLAALSMARSGDLPHAQNIADDLNRRFPVNTMIQNVWLPTIRAQIELAHGNGAKAVELLKPATSYELGEGIGSLNFVCILPAYTRGEAYLAAKDGASAAAEFQKILDHRGLVSNCWTGALSHLGIARANALSGDTAKARTSYQDFFAIWKDADPNIPLLQQAKAEYAKLQ